MKSVRSIGKWVRSMYTRDTSTSSEAPDDTESRDRWDERFMGIARLVSRWSKDPSSQVGAVIVDEHRSIVAEGYNGFVRGTSDDEHLLNDREYKYSRTIHAEMNSIFAAGRTGVKLSGATMYVYGLPTCHACALGISQVGIKRVVVGVPVGKDVRHWADEWEMTKSIFSEAGVSYCYIEVAE